MISASANFTPGLALRSSSSTFTPASSSRTARSAAAAAISSPLPVASTWTSYGASSRGQHSPFSSQVPSATAATARETPTPYDPMVTVTSLPFWSSTLRPSASAYLRPSWKMWPISIPRASSQRAGSVGRRVALAELGDVDHAVGGEVAAAGQVEDVPAGLVGAGRPSGCRRRPAGRPGKRIPDGLSSPSAAGPM